MTTTFNSGLAGTLPPAAATAASDFGAMRMASRSTTSTLPSRNSQAGPGRKD